MRLSKKRRDFEKECVFHDKEGGDGDLPEKPKDANEMYKVIAETQIQSCYPMKVRLTPDLIGILVPDVLQPQGARERGGRFDLLPGQEG